MATFTMATGVRRSTTPTGTRIGLHQERMASQEERSRMRNHWKAVADELARVLAAG